jgi:hypothetical protein
MTGLLKRAGGSLQLGHEVVEAARLDLVFKNRRHGHCSALTRMSGLYSG